MPMLSVEVFVTPNENERSIFAEDAIATPENVDSYKANKEKAIETARRLNLRGFQIDNIGEFSISVTCEAGMFTEFFGTDLEECRDDVQNAQEGTPPTSYLAPAKNAEWQPPEDGGFSEFIERAYIQRPPILFNERVIPPFWNDKFRLRVPGDVALLMNASKVHDDYGVAGQAITVAMVDSGFMHHPYFEKMGYNFIAIPAPDTTRPYDDPVGHGTGECANLFATAPEINFIGVKYRNPTLGFRTGVDMNPHIMTNSWGYSVDKPNTSMPNFLRPLYLEVMRAVNLGITVCFSAGNGHFAFPGSMPEVISVGGVFVDEDLTYQASNYASGFASTWFPGRNVPDVCGLVGQKPRADYIVLPVPEGSQLNRQAGWGAFSGTSAACPMVAGLCALMLEANPNLGPKDIKNFLKYTARDITQGVNAMGKHAAPGPDLATGFGLADGARAIDAIL